MAAYSVLKTGTVQERILEVILHAGSHGCIADDLKLHPDTKSIPINSLTARIVELEHQERIFRNGDTRTGAKGLQQQVMRHGSHAAAFGWAFLDAPAPADDPENRGFLRATRAIWSVIDEPTKSILRAEWLRLNPKPTSKGATS